MDSDNNNPHQVDLDGDKAVEVAKLLRKGQGERVREARKKAGFTIDVAAEKAGMHPNTLGRIERGEKEPDLEQLLRLADALQVNPLRLMPFAEVERLQQPAIDDGEFALVDMLDVSASAGSGSINGEHEVLGRFAFRRSWLKQRGVKPESARIIRARGSSMADRINDGDVLLVDTAVKHHAGDGVYVIELDGLDYVKVLQRDFASGGLQIISFNNTFPPQQLSAERAADLRISGRVVWHGGEL